MTEILKVLRVLDNADMLEFARDCKHGIHVCVRLSHVMQSNASDQRLQSLWQAALHNLSNCLHAGLMEIRKQVPSTSASLPEFLLAEELIQKLATCETIEQCQFVIQQLTQVLKECFDYSIKQLPELAPKLISKSRPQS